jgi:hypothetical protein
MFIWAAAEIQLLSGFTVARPDPEEIENIEWNGYPRRSNRPGTKFALRGRTALERVTDPQRHDLSEFVTRTP